MRDDHTWVPDGPFDYTCSKCGIVESGVYSEEQCEYLTTIIPKIRVKPITRRKRLLIKLDRLIAKLKNG